MALPQTTVGPGPITGSPSRFTGLRRTTKAYFRTGGGVAGAIVLAAVIAAALLSPLVVHPQDLDVTRVTGPSLSGPSLAYPLGTDQAGRSVLLMVLWGSRSSLAIGLAATAMTMIVGSVIGLVAGHYGRWVGRGLMHVTDWVLALPSLPLAISLAAVLGQGPLSITIAITATAWTGTARLVRAQTLTVEARPFVERARALGASDGQILRRHVLPSVMPVILVSSTLTIASAILSATTLSFLGLGDPETVSWGSMLQLALNEGALTAGAWWYLVPPGLAIVVVVLGFTMFGRALETVLNPRALGRR